MSPNMTVREVEHDVLIEAPADEIYRLIAEVVHWPRIFPPTIHVERLEHGEGEERIQIWATANGEPKTWTSRRTLDPTTRVITFRQEVSAPPVATMGGTWLIEEAGPTTSRVRLLHDYSAVDDDEAGLRWIDEAVDRNSRSELEALKRNIELARATADLTFSFTDTVRVEGSAADLFDFVNEGDKWGERLPHVATVRCEELSPGLQVLEMDTRAKDGSTHTTKSYRVCFPHQAIAYKQVTLPALMTLHTGLWTFVEDGSGVLASSQHTVVLRPENIEKILGPQADVAQAKEYVQSALSTNSLATLTLAKAWAEGKRGS